MMDTNGTFRVATRCEAKGCGKIATKKIYIRATKFCLCDDCFDELCRACSIIKKSKVVGNENAEN